MQIAFRTSKLEKQCSSDAELMKAFKLRAKKVKQRINEITVASNLSIMMNLKALRCDQLTSRPEKEWTIQVTSNFVMLFVLDHDPLPMDENGVLQQEKVTRIIIEGFQ